MSDKPRFMRFVVRPGCRGGMVGINVNLFEEGMVYEVQEIDGEYLIKKLGPSPLSLSDEAEKIFAKTIRVGLCNGRDYNSLYREHGGSLVRTVAELSADVPHACQSQTTADGNGAFCCLCGKTLA